MRYGTPNGAFELTSLPGCSQLVVSHFAFVRDHGKGLGSVDHVNRLKTIKSLGYDYALCTVDASNAAQRKILAKNGWKYLDEFKSSKTKHQVCIYGRPVE